MCFVLFITTFTSGCLAFPVPGNDSESLAKKDEVKTLIGESQESVIRKLGLPDQWESQGTRQFMTYSLGSPSKLVMTVYLFPVGVFDGGWTIHCYRLEIDSNNMVKDYKIGSKVRGYGRDAICQHALTNDWELPNIEIHAMRKIPTIMISSQPRTNQSGFLDTPYRGAANNGFLETPYRGKVTNNGSINSLFQFKEGDLISMTTNKGITIVSTKVTSLKIAVVESDNTKIRGRLSGFLGYVDETMENGIGSTVDIMRVDIENIWIEEIRP
jgi:hypothetical protein